MKIRIPMAQTEIKNIAITINLLYPYILHSHLHSSAV
jgi:hypothetical protein